MANLRKDTRTDREGLDFNPPHIPGTANAMLADLFVEDWHDIIAGRDTGIDERRKRIVGLRLQLQEEAKDEMDDPD